MGLVAVWSLVQKKCRNQYFAHWISLHLQEEADPNSAYPCTAYDSRKRPWYNGAISHPNHLVILLDIAFVPLDVSYVEQSDALSMATDFAKALLYSVYYEDRINVVEFNTQAKPLVPLSVRTR